MRRSVSFCWILFIIFPIFMSVLAHEFEKPGDIHVNPKDFAGNVISLKHMVVNFEHKVCAASLVTVLTSDLVVGFLPNSEIRLLSLVSVISSNESRSKLVTGFPMVSITGCRFEPPWHKPVTSFRDLNISTIEMILNDPNWTKAIFFRNPPRRLLSAYTYLIVHDGDPRLREKFLQQAHPQPPRWKRFVSLVLNESSHQPLRDLHFRPQTDFCRFSKYHSIFNFVGTFEEMATEGALLLKKLKIWDTYGSSGWSIAGLIKSNILQRNRSKGIEIRYNLSLPQHFNQNDCMFCGNNSPHQANYSSIFLSLGSTSNRSQSLNEIITFSLWDSIRRSQFYHFDYQLFKILSLKAKDPQFQSTSSTFISPNLQKYLSYF